MAEQNFKNQVKNSTFWLFGANFISRSVSFISTLILAKLLLPEDFGLVGYGFLVVSTIGLFKDMGFNSSLIYQKNRVEEAGSGALWLISLWSGVLYLIIFCSAPVVSIFFREPRLISLLRILSLSLIINSMSSIPITLLEKDINFKKSVIPEMIQLTLYGFVTVILAILGFKYWSFVIGTLISDIIKLIIAFIFRPVKINFKPDFVLLKEMFAFGKDIMGLGIIYFGIRNIDDFFVGRMLGTVQLGIYQFSYRIANIPATNITNTVGKVFFPAYTKISGDLERLKDVFLKSTEYIITLTVPVTFFIILVIPDFINLFYQKWINAVLPIQLIAYYGGVRSIGANFGSVFYATGKPKNLIPVALAQILLLSIFLYPAIHYWGLIGVCFLININMSMSFIWSLVILRPVIKLRYKELVNILIFPLLVSSISLLMSIFSIHLLYLYCCQNLYILFIIKIVSFIVFSILSILIFTDTISKMINDIRQPS